MQIGFENGFFTSQNNGLIHGDCDPHENSNDRDDDHEFEQRKAAFTSLYTSFHPMQSQLTSYTRRKRSDHPMIGWSAHLDRSACPTPMCSSSDPRAPGARTSISCPPLRSWRRLRRGRRVSPGTLLCQALSK